MNRILGIGGVAYDMLSVVDNMPAWEDIEYIEKYEVQQGGMAATGIVTACKLGAQTEFIGAIGNDLQGQFQIDTFSTNGVKHDNIRIYENDISPLTIVLIHSVTGRRSFIHYKGVNTKPELDSVEIDLTGVSHILFDGFFFNTALEVAKRARELGIVSVTDMSQQNRNPKIMEYLSFIDYPVLSELFVCPYTNISDPLEAGKSLFQETNKALLVTCGSKGSYIITKDSIEHIPAFEIKPVDSTGAGDVFHGALIFSIWKGYGLKESVSFASACAALICEKIGGQIGIPSFEETKEFVLKHQPSANEWLR